MFDFVDNPGSQSIPQVLGSFFHDSPPLSFLPYLEQVTQVGRTKWGRIDKGEGKI